MVASTRGFSLPPRATEGVPGLWLVVGSQAEGKNCAEQTGSEGQRPSQGRKMEKRGDD